MLMVGCKLVSFLRLSFGGFNVDKFCNFGGDVMLLINGILYVLFVRYDWIFFVSRYWIKLIGNLLLFSVIIFEVFIR